MLLSATSCSGSLFKVKPPSVFFKVKPAASLSPLSPTAKVDLGAITLQAAPLLTDEETQELFESNLQLAGLLPVRVEIIHNSGEAIELSRVRFHLRDATTAEWKFVSAKQAIRRILKANGVSTYNPYSRKVFEKEFRAYELDLRSPLTHSERQRQGLVIFLAPGKNPVTSPHGLVLTVDGLSQPATLKLN